MVYQSNAEERTRAGTALYGMAPSLYVTEMRQRGHTRPRRFAPPSRNTPSGTFRRTLRTALAAAAPTIGKPYPPFHSCAGWQKSRHTAPLENSRTAFKQNLFENDHFTHRQIKYNMESENFQAITAKTQKVKIYRASDHTLSACDYTARRGPCQAFFWKSNVKVTYFMPSRLFSAAGRSPARPARGG